MDALAVSVLRGFLRLVLFMGAFVFVPAWTLRYWQGWVFLGVFFSTAVVITLYLWRKDRGLLERRLHAGFTAEKQKSQKVIMLLASVGFCGLLVVPSLDHRFGWSHVPVPVVIGSDLLVVLGYLGILRVFRENTFSGGTIEVAQDQRVVSTGPYAVVRHPMYAASFFMFLGIPLALGSWWGLLVFIPLVPVLIWRLLDEEEFLARNLPGYSEYQQTVRWRLVPHVW